MLLFGVISFFLSMIFAEELQTVDQVEFLKLITEEQYVLALFCPSTAAERCGEFEGELTSIREDMIDVMEGDGWVVKLVDSPLVEDYAVGKTEQPVIVMFRKGLPVLYDGPANEEIMLDTLVSYKEPGVQELTDSTFEHLTQAATGATTGDWLVMFFTSSCTLCSRLTATMETLACKYKGRMNVARINKETYGEKTGRRFELGLEDKPDIILFRLGRMYKYELTQYDPESLASFMTGFYKNYPALSIPLPKSPFDDLVQLCVDYLKAYPVQAGAGLCVPFILLLSFLLLFREGEEPKTKKSKKKKKDDQKEKKESKKES